MRDLLGAIPGVASPRTPALSVTQELPPQPSTSTPASPPPPAGGGRRPRGKRRAAAQQEEEDEEGDIELGNVNTADALLRDTFSQVAEVRGLLEKLAGHLDELRTHTDAMVGSVNEQHQKGGSAPRCWLTPPPSPEVSQAIEGVMFECNKLSSTARTRLKAMEAAAKGFPEGSAEQRAQSLQQQLLGKRLMTLVATYQDVQRAHKDAMRRKMMRQLKIGERSPLPPPPFPPTLTRPVPHSGAQCDGRGDQSVLGQRRQRYSDTRSDAGGGFLSVHRWGSYSLGIANGTAARQGRRRAKTRPGTQA